jgi:hypothetical protein
MCRDNKYCPQQWFEIAKSLEGCTALEKIDDFPWTEEVLKLPGETKSLILKNKGLGECNSMAALAGLLTHKTRITSSIVLLDLR